MDLEQVSAEIRPRHGWEASDLGIALVRANYGAIMRQYLGITLVIQLAIVTLFWNAPVWGMFIVSWIAVLTDRITLHFLSRSLFGSRPRFWETVKALPSLFRHASLWSLTIGRFSINLFVTSPVIILEQHAKPQRKIRCQQIVARTYGKCSSLLICSTLLYLCVFYMLILVGISMLPESMSTEREAFDAFLENLDEYAIVPDSVWRFLSFINLAVLALLRPFIIGAGFGLYINSRTEIEGWDVSLTFQRLSSRIAKMGSRLGVVLLAAMLAVTSSEPVQAQASDRVIDEVLSSEDFQLKVETLTTTDNEGIEIVASPGDFSWLAGIFKVLFWLLVIAAAVFLIYLLIQNRHVFRWNKRLTEEAKTSTTKTVAGLDIRPEALPEGIAAAAQAAWQAGNPLEALSLLYRGSISRYVTSGMVHLRESDTEFECVTAVTNAPSHPAADYFVSLSQHWIGAAYGREMPSEGEMSALIGEWPYAGAWQPQSAPVAEERRAG